MPYHSSHQEHQQSSGSGYSASQQSSSSSAAAAASTSAPTAAGSKPMSMFKQRNQGSRKSGSGFKPPKIFGTSSTSSAPLLASAQSPAGMYNRLSDSSENMHHDQPLRYGPSGGPSNPSSAGYSQASVSSFSSATDQRYGPTANLLPQRGVAAGGGSVEAVPPPFSSALASATPGPMSGYDENDLDDQLHTFTAADRKDLSTPFTFNSWRGWANGITLFILMAGFVVLFAGYPIIDSYWRKTDTSASPAGFNLGGLNASGQVPEIPGFPSLIDPDTPEEVRNTPHRGYDGSDWKLVFSDEFNKDGRTFYPGDDPFWTAVDIHYWPTNDFEWYDPSQATTKDGHLVLTMVQEPNHGLMFKSGMIQSWNQLCFFKNAYYEVSASLPGTPQTGGFWPGIWTMANLVRAGYGGTSDGMWPYSYTACDVGILPNQTYEKHNGSMLPEIAYTSGDRNYGNSLSYLPGQRLSSCNCPGTGDHPGPEGVGRGGVEIDMIEAQMDLRINEGIVSQSAQVAPYDPYYQFGNVTGKDVIIYDDDVTHWNTYLGSIYQQAVSGLSYTKRYIYANESSSDPVTGKFGVFGVEYVSDFEKPESDGEGYIHWINMGKPAWTMLPSAVGPNPVSGVGQRLISQEPMYVIFNFGMSNNFEYVDFKNLIVPNEMRIDYIRVYQRDDGQVGCDPEERPTAAYIERHLDIFNNPNISTWEASGHPLPRNRMMEGGCG